MKFHEDGEQKALFDWAAYHPELRWMFAIPNGGNRNKLEAVRLKQGGVKKGVSDIFLPKQSKINGVYCGLFIEMKRRKVDGPSRVSWSQFEFQKGVEQAGYKCVICYGADEAIEEIKKYVML
jgi:hypothetical protein